jgi:hypothetical protein
MNYGAGLQAKSLKTGEIEQSHTNIIRGPYEQLLRKYLVCC